MWTSFCIFTTMVVSIEASKNIAGSKLSKTSDAAAKVFSCQPNITYVHGLETCVCTNNGQWPKNCTIFEELYSSKTLRSTCKRNSYVTVHCNVCKCDHKGEVNYQKCTKHSCESGDKLTKNRRFVKNINSECEPKMWYSFAPCQLCYCISDNKLICNPDKKEVDTVVLGKHNFTVCGDTFLKDTIDLIPEKEQVLRLGDSDVEIEPIDEIEDMKEAHLKKEDNSNDVDQSDSDESNETKKPLRSRFKKDPNPVDVDDEDSTKDVDLRTKMPEYEKIVSNEVTEHVNKRKVEESDSEEVFVPAEDEDKKEVVSLNSEENVVTEKSEAIFKLNLPNILKNIVKIGFRRDDVRKMVSIDSKSSCKPGTKMAVKCNTCFCMRNGKLVCTMKLCLDEF